MDYEYESFTESQLQILDHFVTNASSNVFVLHNLPEVIKGALFSRYSRSVLGLRSLLLKEFILNEETAFTAMVGNTVNAEDSVNQRLAIQKAQNFYDRILDGYGDDSIGELGGAHLAMEQLSMLAAKMVEDSRIGGSPLEKSTRYVYFDQKVDGNYAYYREPILMTSAFRELYESICNHLFETYSLLIPPLTARIEEGFPRDPALSKTAYTAALRAKVLDCLRGLLPASTLTNMGIYGNGRFFETLLQKMNGSTLAEIQELGKKAYTELAKVIPSFIRRAESSHKHQQSYTTFIESTQQALQVAREPILRRLYSLKKEESSVRLIQSDPESVAKVAGALLFEDTHFSLEALQKHCQTLSSDEIAALFDAVVSARKNRRHKSPRALEHASFTFEIVADFGIYRDLQRHRMLTQERQPLTCDLGYYLPSEILGTEMEEQYRSSMERAKQAYERIVPEFPEEAQYIVPMAYHMRWYFQINLRALQWMCELRSSPQGHPTYRLIAQEMARQVSDQFPLFAKFFQFVDYEGYELGRLSAEIRQAERKQSTATI